MWVLQMMACVWLGIRLVHWLEVVFKRQASRRRVPSSDSATRGAQAHGASGSNPLRRVQQAAPLLVKIEARTGAPLVDSTVVAAMGGQG